VTGGNGGIGKGMARAFAEYGCVIALAARNRDKMDAAGKEMEKEFKVPVMGVEVDVSQEQQIHEMVQKVLQEFGRIDVLVNNAGISIRKKPQDYLLSEWDEVLTVNLRSAFLCSQAVYSTMKLQGGGKIINIGSMTSIFGYGPSIPYATSKGGIVQLTRSLAVAWASDNIQVNAILPGWIDTELTQRARKALPDLHDRVLSRTPAGRWGEPADLGGAAVFFASNASDYLTGVALPVDGGFSVML